MKSWEKLDPVSLLLFLPINMIAKVRYLLKDIINYLVLDLTNVVPAYLSLADFSKGHQ